MNQEQLRRQRDYAELAQRQHEYNASQARRSVERAACEAMAKDEAAQRAVEQALATILRQGLDALPGVFEPTQLSSATVDAWAARWAAEIA